MNRSHLGQLIVIQIPRLRRYARALTRHPESADDLVQDCLERAWKKIDRWELGSDLRAWLFTMMHNVHANNRRRRQVETLPMTRTDYPAPENPVGDHALQLRDLQVGLAQLSQDQREVLLLVCLEEMTYEQVSSVLGIPLGTVMSRLHRGRERLRRWMSEVHVVKPPLRRVK